VRPTLRLAGVARRCLPRFCVVLAPPEGATNAVRLATPAVPGPHSVGYKGREPRMLSAWGDPKIAPMDGRSETVRTISF